MGMMSQAEARLDASIRPEITLLRSRMSYPMRQRRVGSGTGADTPDTPDTPGRPADDAAGDRAPRPKALPPAVGRVPITDRPGRPWSAQVRSGRAPSPIRLTRRGRVVVGFAVAVGVAVLAGLLWLTLGGQAHASSHLTGSNPQGHEMFKVVVRPGQTLWSIAVHTDPSADPRVVIGEIISGNSLTGTTIGVGEVLWVPRG